MPDGCGGESWLLRAQRLKEPLGLPDISFGEYLLEAMFRLGPTRCNGMAVTPADWSDIDAFARLTGRISEPWEAEILHDMCQAYHDARQAGENPLAMSPVELATDAS